MFSFRKTPREPIFVWEWVFDGEMIRTGAFLQDSSTPEGVKPASVPRWPRSSLPGRSAFIRVTFPSERISARRGSGPLSGAEWWCCRRERLGAFSRFHLLSDLLLLTEGCRVAGPCTVPCGRPPLTHTCTSDGSFPGTVIISDAAQTLHWVSSSPWGLSSSCISICFSRTFFFFWNC